MEVWRARREENCQEGLAGLGWRGGGRVPSSAVSNHVAERILLNQKPPERLHLATSKREAGAELQRVLLTTTSLGSSVHWFPRYCLLGRPILRQDTWSFFRQSSIPFR